MKSIKKIGVILSFVTACMMMLGTSLMVCARPGASMDPAKKQLMESCRVEDVNETDLNDSIKQIAQSYIDKGDMVFDLNSLSEKGIKLKGFKGLDGNGILVINSYYSNKYNVIKEMSNEEFAKTYSGGNAAGYKIPNRFYYDQYNRLESMVTYDHVGEIVYLENQRFVSDPIDFEE
ncbi:MAG: hypothetical protein IKS48_12470 [Eubacterium sp.]|nr:hypothetical protein [Eubacterium sp.]